MLRIFRSSPKPAPAARSGSLTFLFCAPLTLLCTPAFANGGFYGPDVTIVGILIYEIAVAFVEGVIIFRMKPDLSGSRALAASIAANASSFMAGLVVFGFLVTVANPISTWEFFDSVFGVFMGAMLLLNIVIELPVVIAITRMKPARVYVPGLALMNVGTFVAGLFLIPFPAHYQLSPVNRAKNDQRSLATGLETYFVDYQRYPDVVPMSAYFPMAGYGSRPALRRRDGGEVTAMAPSQLTSPVAYLTSHFSDPYAPYRGLPFSYYGTPNGFIIISPGPDRQYEINPVADYDTSVPQLSLTLILHQYDSTNGAESGGDVFRVKN